MAGRKPGHCHIGHGHIGYGDLGVGDIGLVIEAFCERLARSRLTLL